LKFHFSRGIAATNSITSSWDIISRMRTMDFGITPVLPGPPILLLLHSLWHMTDGWSTNKSYNPNKRSVLSITGIRMKIKMYTPLLEFDVNVDKPMTCLEVYKEAFIQLGWIPEPITDKKARIFNDGYTGNKIVKGNYHKFYWNAQEVPDDFIIPLEDKIFQIIWYVDYGLDLQ
jgi:hypothetical protein